MPWEQVHLTSSSVGRPQEVKGLPLGPRFFFLYQVLSERTVCRGFSPLRGHAKVRQKGIAICLGLAQK